MGWNKWIEYSECLIAYKPEEYHLYIVNTPSSIIDWTLESIANL